MKIISLNDLEDSELNDFFAVTLSKKSLIPIIGSGFTRNERAKNGVVPDGKQFQNIMIKEICRCCSEISENDFIEEGYKFSTIASEFFKRVPVEDYKYILRNLFTEVSLGDYKRKFLKINWPYIYTLNIDDAIENNSCFNPVKPYKKLSKNIDELNCVFKMHGDVKDELFYEELPNIIFSEEQYIKSLEENSYILSYFQGDYSTKNIIFIGCSLEDELDLKYAIATTKKIRESSVSRIYVTSNEPKGLRKSRLEDFGITKILLVDDYDFFYNYLFGIYDQLRFCETNPFEQFKNPNIEICPKELYPNKKFLLDIVGEHSTECSLPFFAEKREITAKITKRILEETVTVISGKRFSGKTCLAKFLITSLQDKDVYFFPSNISFSNLEINDLLKLQNSYLIFDTNSLDVGNVSEIEKLIVQFSSRRLYLVIIVNKSDNLVHSVASAITNNNYYRIEDKFTDNEILHVNRKLSEIGLIKLNKTKNLLDNCFEAYRVYQDDVFFDSYRLTDKEFMLSVVIASDGKAYSILYNIFGINKKEIDLYTKKLSPFIECQLTGNIEAHQHSGSKIVLNSSSWLFKILNEYKKNYGHNKIVSNIYEIIKQLTKNQKAFAHLHKKIITFDNLNQIFSGKEKGEGGLILNLYERLESVLFNDDHFWLQRAKSILNLKRTDIEHLNMAKDFAKKAYYDSNSEKFKIYATTTIALIYGRIALVNNFSNSNELQDAIKWYYMALQVNQYNKRYVADILEKAKKNDSDIKNLCDFLLKNNHTVHLDKNTKKEAEYIINKIFNSRNDMQSPVVGLS